VVKQPRNDQAKRFEEAAREGECDETGAAFDRAFAKIVPPKPRPVKDEKKPKRRS
jgi:hypothetical protein